jgi:tetratricopeptide (TPR) repeat protein
MLSVGVSFGQKEKDLKQQALDDVKALSKKDFPYIENFHSAVREKLAGNLNEAKVFYEACLKERQNDDAVHFGLATIAKQQKDLKTAQKHFELAFELDPDNITYLQELAYLAFEQSRFESATKYYQRLVEKQPRNIDWIYGYSQVLIYNRDYKAATEMLEKLQDQVGVVPELMIMKSDLYQEIKSFDKAEATLLQFVREFPENREAFQQLSQFYKKHKKAEEFAALIEQLSQEYPQNMLIKMKQAEMYGETGEKDKLMDVLNVIIRSPQVETYEKIEQLNRLLKQFEVENTKLLELTQLLIDSDATDPGASLLHAEVLTQNHKSNEALPFYRASLNKSGEQFEVWTTVLAFESAYREYQALYEDGEKALSYFPNMPFVYYSAAEGAIYTGHPEEALDILAAGELYILDNQQQKARFEMRKGEAHFAMKSYKKGIQFFESALSIKADPKIRMTYAYCLAKAGIALSVALEQLDTIEDEQQNEQYYLTVATLHIASKAYNDAEKTLKKGINECFYVAELHDVLGDVYLLKEKKDKAKVAWNKALELGSRNRTIDQKIKEEQLYAPKYY